MGRVKLLTAAVALPVALFALPAAATAAAPNPCPGAAISPDQVITGNFSTAQEGAFVFLPVDVPAGQTAVRVKYCYDQPDIPIEVPPVRIRHTLDIGLFQPRQPATGIWGKQEFRGWSGSNISDFTVTPEGPAPATGRGTTRTYEPGPIPAGEWAVELGLASVVGLEGGDLDSKVAWRVEVDWSNDSADGDEPYQPAAYDSTPANPNPGWYEGDFHVHGQNSGDASSATYRRLFGYSFCPDPALGTLCDPPESQPGAGLDFITLNDHNNGVAWGQIGAFQPDYPGHLVIRSEEVTTYRGHMQNHGSATWVDYRTGPVLRASLTGSPGDRTVQSVSQERAPTSPGEPAGIFDQTHAGGGFTQINHPSIFPSAVPGFAELCRGCPWNYNDAETDYSKVDAIEVSTGPAGLRLPPLNPGPNPFTPLALQFYEDALGTGAHIAAVGGSDSHSAGEIGDVTELTDSPVGVPTTVVYAPELSEQGIEDGIDAGHSYVKLFGDGPDLRFEARPAGSSDPPAIMGDTVNAAAVDLTARVLGAGPSAPRPGPYVLLVLRDGLPFTLAPVTGDDFTLNFASGGNGRYRLQLMRLSGAAAIEAVSTPIYVAPPGPPAAQADLSVTQTDAPDPVTIPGELNYEVTLANGGPDTAEDVELNDLLPQGAGFISAVPSTGTCSQASGVVNCQLGDLVSGATATVAIKVVPMVAGTAENTAIAGSATADPTAANNSQTEQTTVLAQPTDGGPSASGAGACTNQIRGSRRRDQLNGTAAGDRIRGRGGNDVIRGQRGQDCLYGNRGNDRIRAFDGERDLVRCGRGRDRAQVDRMDSVRGCERVRRV